MDGFVIHSPFRKRRRKHTGIGLCSVWVPGRVSILYIPGSLKLNVLCWWALCSQWPRASLACLMKRPLPFQGSLPTLAPRFLYCLWGLLFPASLCFSLVFPTSSLEGVTTAHCHSVSPAVGQDLFLSRPGLKLRCFPHLIWCFSPMVFCLWGFVFWAACLVSPWSPSPLEGRGGPLCVLCL